jgi:prepilin peptidase CpaA
MTIKKGVFVEVWVSNLPMLFLAALTLAMLAVIYFDMREFIIPNNLCIAIAMLYLPGFYFLHLNPVNGLITGGIVLVLGMGLFALKVMGGGDIKLLAALALWTGWNEVTLSFLFAMAIFGGIFAIAVMVLRNIVRLPNLPRILTKGQPIPYGVAIAAAFLLVLWKGQIFPFSL